MNFVEENQVAHDERQQKWGKELPQGSLKIPVADFWHVLVFGSVLYFALIFFFSPISTAVSVPTFKNSM